jgi:ribosomal protein L16 Arg81 hydroxylase
MSGAAGALKESPDNEARQRHVNYDLDTILWPLTREIFFREYWTRKCCVVSGRDPGAYNRLFSAANVEPLLSLTGLGPQNTYRVVKSEQGRTVSFEPPDGGSAGIHYFYRAFSQGYTIVVDTVHTRWGAIAALCSSLQAEFDHPAECGLFFTPPRSQGFQPHYDDHDVFVLQLDGSKRWRLYDSPEPLPRPKEIHPPLPRNIGEPARELVLNPGDLLYIPEGCIHEAATSESHSLHLSIRITVYRWLDLMLEMWKESARHDVELRKALPAGFLHSDGTALDSELRRLIAGLDIETARASAVAGLAKSLLKHAGPPAADGHFASLQRLEELGLDTVVRRRAGISVRVRQSPEGAAIEFEANLVTGAASLASAFDYISRVTEFRPRDILPARLTDQVRLALVRRLVEEGLLCIPAAGEASAAKPTL